MSVVGGRVDRGTQVTVRTGGERGIRTLEGLLTLTPLAGVRLRPLGHLSASLKSFNFQILESVPGIPGASAGVAMIIEHPAKGKRGASVRPRKLRKGVKSGICGRGAFGIAR